MDSDQQKQQVSKVQYSDDDDYPGRSSIQSDKDKQEHGQPPNQAQSYVDDKNKKAQNQNNQNPNGNSEVQGENSSNVIVQQPNTEQIIHVQNQNSQQFHSLHTQINETGTQYITLQSKQNNVSKQQEQIQPAIQLISQNQNENIKIGQQLHNDNKNNENDYHSNQNRNQEQFINKNQSQNLTGEKVQQPHEERGQNYAVTPPHLLDKLTEQNQYGSQQHHVIPVVHNEQNYGSEQHHVIPIVQDQHQYGSQQHHVIPVVHDEQNYGSQQHHVIPVVQDQQKHGSQQHHVIPVVQGQIQYGSQQHHVVPVVHGQSKSNKTTEVAVEANNVQKDYKVEGKSDQQRIQTQNTTNENGYNQIAQQKSKTQSVQRQTKPLYEQQHEQDDSVISRRILAASVKQKPKVEQGLGKNAKPCECTVM